jgi:c-di-GMP-binding flagellar brake protein YcgR
LKSESEEITDPARVVPLLERLAKRRTPLAVKVNGHAEQFSSCIVNVDQKHVLLDELLPSSGHALLLSKRKLQVIAKLDGIDICFDTTLERVDTEDRVVTYYAQLPGQIAYGQRRLDFRVHIPMATKLRVIIDSSDGSVFEGVLHDLSHGGAGMVFPGGKPNVTAGVLHDCAIELSDHDWLFTTVELRYSKRITFRDRQLIGARFADISPAQAQLIRQHICDLQRELLRKRAAD